MISNIDVSSNPQNPTGAVIPRETLEVVVEIARQSSIIIHSDEVYRPLFHSMDKEQPPSLLSLGYERTVVTGSMSKAYALAGLRVGWIASRDRGLIEACASARDYTTISVSAIDDSLASHALSQACVQNLLKRNMELAKTNVAILERFIDFHRRTCDWAKPLAGTTAFVRFSKMGKPVDDTAFCEMLLEKTGVMFVPGSACFGRDGDFRGYVRIGFVNETDVLKKGLEALGSFMENGYEEVPVGQ